MLEEGGIWDFSGVSGSSGTRYSEEKSLEQPSNG